MDQISSAAMTTEVIDGVAEFLDKDLSRRIPWDIVRDGVLQFGATQTFLARMDDGVQLSDIKEELIEYVESICDQLIEDFTPPNGRTN